MNDIQNTEADSLPRRSSRFTLQTKVLVWISAVISIVFVSAVSAAMYLIHDDRRADLEARAEYLADVQSTGLARPIWDFEFEQAAGMLNTLTQDPDFRYAAIEAVNGDIIGDFGTALQKDETAIFIVRRDIVHRSDSAAGASGKRVGTLTLVLSESRLRESLKTMILGGMGLLCLILVFVVTAVTRALKMITKPLTGIARAMAGLAAGDLATPVPSLDRNDEVGEMGRAVQIFKENAEQKAVLEEEQARTKKLAEEERRRSVLELADRFEEAVKDVATKVSWAASEMETTAQDMSSTAEQTTQQSESVVSASDEVTENVQTVATTADQLASSIDEIGRQVNKSANVAANAVREAEKTTETVHSLSMATGKIGEVVTLISEIAGQTNLLALNATIEAARAGDAGKGFAVVAQEVKNLASQTAKATDEIGQQISAVQTETTNVVSAIDTITGIIGEISEISAIIAAAIEEQGASTEEIARRVQSAADGTKQVNTNIGGVSQAAGETGSAATKVLSASREVSQHAGGLFDAVDSFVKEIRAD